MSECEAVREYEVTYLEGPYVRRVAGRIEASVGDVVGVPTTVVVSTDGAAHFIPVRCVITCEETEESRTGRAMDRFND